MKAATESRLDNRQQESTPIYIDSFRAYEPLYEDDAFTHECVIHGDGEYVAEKRSREHLREQRVAGATVDLAAEAL